MVAKMLKIEEGLVAKIDDQRDGRLRGNLKYEFAALAANGGAALG